MGGNYWQRRFSRSQMLKATALGSAGLGAATLLGCGGNQPAATTSTISSTSTASPEVQRKRGGTLTHLGPNSGLFTTGFDPHVVITPEAGIMNLFYQGLVRFEPSNAEVQPELSQRWEQPSSTEYIFRLAPGVKWHNKAPVNGRALTAEDAAFSLRRAKSDDPRFVHRGLMGSIDKIEAIDQSSLRITTKQPDVTAVLGLSGVGVKILAPEVVERAGRFTTADTAVGTGAFIITDHSDTSATTVRNPDYWKQGSPYLDGVKLVDIRDPQTAWAAFRAGGIDVVTVPGAESEKVLSDQTKTFNSGVAKGTIVNMIWTNVRMKPFDDARVPKALRLLVDHQEAINGWLKVWFGAGNSFTLPHIEENWELPASEYATKLEWKQPKDEAIRESLALLSAAGFTKDNPLRFVLSSSNSPHNSAAGQLQQAQWNKLGQGALDSKIEIFDSPTLLTRQSRGEFDVTGPMARTEEFDPDQTFRSYYYSGSTLNFGKFSDTTLDGMIDRQRTIFNAEQRKTAVREIINYLIDKAPYNSFASHSRVNGWQDKVKDFTPESGNPHMWQYEHVWLDT